MRENKEQAFAWVLKDERARQVPGGHLLWSKLFCDELPGGLDYFVFDTAVDCGHEAARRWVELLAHNPICFVSYHSAVDYLSRLDGEAVLAGLELYRRRRYKSDPDWHLKGTDWSNRCTRAKRRALKLIQAAALKPLFPATTEGILRDEVAI